MKHITVSHRFILERCQTIAAQIQGTGLKTLAGVPRGGTPVALTIAGMLPDMLLIDDFMQADVVVDDIVDSGATRKRVMDNGKCQLFFALVDKTTDPVDGWVVFPWEMTAAAGAEDIVTRQLQYLGEDPTRDGLKDTPARVVRSWDHLFGGYSQDPVKVLGTVFENENGYDEMVILKNIEFYSTCEHHLLPFFGKAHIAYIPDARKVVGISKLARLLECFARRAQIQERLTDQITATITKCLQPLGAACLIEAQHFCMTSRGVQKQNSIMTTSSLTGVFKNQATRAEFFALVKGQ